MIDNATSAALQAGIWEIIYENSSAYSLASGSFRVAPQSANSTYLAAFNTVNGYLGHLATTTPTTRSTCSATPRIRTSLAGRFPNPARGRC